MSEPSEDEHFIRKRQTTRVSDDVTSIELRKIFTPAGERLELEAPALGQQIRLDAMELEALSWQKHAAFVTFLERGYEIEIPDRDARIDAIRGSGEADPDTDPVDADEPITVTNEFAEAHVQKVETTDGERLEIRAPKLGYQIRLTAAAVESVTVQSTETFTEFLETPFGPDGH